MADEPTTPQPRQRLTVLEMGGPLNPSPEELATRVIEPLINEGPVCDPPQPAVPAEVPPLVARLLDVVLGLPGDVADTGALRDAVETDSQRT